MLVYVRFGNLSFASIRLVRYSRVAGYMFIKCGLIALAGFFHGIGVFPAELGGNSLIVLAMRTHFYDGDVALLTGNRNTLMLFGDGGVGLRPVAGTFWIITDNVAWTGFVHVTVLLRPLSVNHVPSVPMCHRVAHLY